MILRQHDASHHVSSYSFWVYALSISDNPNFILHEVCDSVGISNISCPKMLCPSTISTTWSEVISLPIPSQYGEMLACYYELATVIIEIQKQYIKDHKKADTFYAIEARGWKFFVAQNESGFTCMFPEDY